MVRTSPERIIDSSCISQDYIPYKSNVHMYPYNIDNSNKSRNNICIKAVPYISYQHY